MASDILHIKDGYYFDVPKTFWHRDFQSSKEVAASFPWYVQLDEDYQDWEADKIITGLERILTDKAPLAELKKQWHEYQHAKSANHGRPLDRYLVEGVDELRVEASKWASKADPGARDPLAAYLAKHPNHPLAWFVDYTHQPENLAKWNDLRTQVNSDASLIEYMQLPRSEWKAEKLKSASEALSGKAFIPQVFGGKLRNAYEPDSGFCLSRYMVIEVVVAILVFVAFRWLAGKVGTGAAPKGKLWNLLEGSVQFVRNQVVVPAMGEHDADRFMPLMWTMFFFILGCNLMGMLPFVGAPTAAFSLTLVLAAIVFLTGFVFGVKNLGFVGFFLNQAPHIDLPFGFGILISALVWVIEMISLCIKHGVLAVRLLANMVAGHLVLLAIMGIAFGAHSVTMHTGTWSFVAVLSIVGTTLLSFLELFVCFLQAYVFTFLAALFIGSSIHEHGH